MLHEMIDFSGELFSTMFVKILLLVTFSDFSPDSFSNEKLPTLNFINQRWTFVIFV